MSAGSGNEKTEKIFVFKMNEEINALNIKLRLTLPLMIKIYAKPDILHRNSLFSWNQDFKRLFVVKI